MNPFLSLYILLLLYSLFFGLSWWVWKRRSDKLTAEAVINGNWNLLHLRHVSGIFIFLFIPVLLIPDLPFHLLRISESISKLQVFFLILTALLILLIASIESANLIKNKIISIQSGTRSQAIIYVVLRTIFLASYEWFFRGCLLFSFINIFGTIPAVAINLVLYALIHSFNGKKEFLSSVPFGLVLCVFTTWWQSVWPAILLHLLLSSSYESIALRSFFYKPSKPSV